METANTITLEFLRTGGPDNQLISSLTPYLAVCENQEPRTVHLPFDHHEYLIRQERLRYEVRSDGGSADREKVEAELLEMGRKISAFLGDVPGIAASFGSSAPGGNSGVNSASGKATPKCAGLIHMELVFSALELSLVPFEATISPDGCPGPGQPLSLQTDRPVTITRRQRGATESCVSWRRSPKILVAISSAGGAVPEVGNLAAIRSAIEPWVKPTSDGPQPTDNRDEQLHVLTNASLQTIRKACAEHDFSHIHILAHGGSRKVMGGDRFGLVLDSHDRRRREVVSGADLAAAIRTFNKAKNELSAPICVTIAACDSGNVNTVIPPGGSVAQELHQAGIPFVIGSQFPLSFEGSIVLADALYSRLLKGDDPRVVLHDVRTRLKLVRGAHDWASIVAYLAESPSMEEDLWRQRVEQARRAGNSAKAWAEWFGKQGQAPTNEAEERFSQAMDWLDKAVGHRPKNIAERGARGEVLGLRGSLLKQRADVVRKVAIRAKNGKEATQDDKWADREKKLLEAARREYFEGAKIGSFGTVVEDWGNVHWLATQYMSLSLILSGKLDDEDWFPLALASCEADIREQNPGFAAWAYATKIELGLLSSFSRNSARASGARDEAIKCARAYMAAVKNPFQIMSTRRQFLRYKEGWLDDYVDQAELASARDQAKATVDEILAILDGG